MLAHATTEPAELHRAFFSRNADLLVTQMTADARKIN